MQKSTPNALLDWKNHDCKWEQIPEVKVSPTTLLWLDCSPFVLPTNTAGLRLTCKEVLDNAKVLGRFRVCAYLGCTFLQRKKKATS